MNATFRTLAAAVALAASLSAGCRVTQPRATSAEPPLLLSPTPEDHTAAGLPGGLAPTSSRSFAAVPATGAVETPYLRRPPTRHAARPARPAESASKVIPVSLELPATAAMPTSAADYSWLYGELEYDNGRWSVRYGHGGTDRFGGALDLVQTGPMAAFRPGQWVRVEGRLIDPQPLEIRPGYRVRSIQAVVR